MKKVNILYSELNAQGKKCEIHYARPITEKARNAFLSYHALLKHGNPDFKPVASLGDPNVRFIRIN